MAIKLDETNGNFFYNRATCYTMLIPPDYAKVVFHPSIISLIFVSVLWGQALENFNLAVTLCDSKYKAYFNRGVTFI